MRCLSLRYIRLCQHETYLGLHEERPRFLYHLNQIWTSRTDVRKSPHYQISRKSAQCDRADTCGQTCQSKRAIFAMCKKATNTGHGTMNTRATRRTEQNKSTTKAVCYSRGSPFESMPKWQLKTGARLLPATSFQLITHYQTNYSRLHNPSSWKGCHITYQQI